MFHFKYKKRTRSLTWEYKKRNSPLPKSGIVVYFKLNKQYLFLFLCVLNGFSRKNPLFFNLSGICVKRHRLRKFAKQSIALACYCTFWTFLIQRNKSGRKQILTYVANTHLGSLSKLRLVIRHKNKD